MKILVTGGTGFIGYHTARHLLAAGHDVRLLVRDENKARKLYGDTMPELAVCDIADRKGIERALRGCGGVIHTAAMVSIDRKDAGRVFETNMEGTRNVVGQAVELGLLKILYLSSVTAIFDVHADVLTETSPPGTATDAYGRSKVACEKYVRELQVSGAPIYISYPASVIGPEDPGLTEPHVGLIGNLHARFAMPGGNQWVDVRDVAAAHVAIMERDLPPGGFCLGGHFLTWWQLGGLLARITGRRLPVVPVLGVTMRSLGRVVDFIQPLLGADSPFTHEAMVYATRWVKMDSSKSERQLDVTFRPVEESVREALLSLLARGQLEDKLAGLLVADSDNSASGGRHD